MPDTYRIRYASRRVAKEIMDLPPEIFSRIDKVIMRLRKDPKPPGCRKLHSQAIGQYRLRVGDWRVIYDVDDVANEVILLRIMHRRQIYRQR